MRIVQDSDTSEFQDSSGDRLVLLSAPRRRDVVKSEELERDEAVAQMKLIREQGLTNVDEAIEKVSQGDKDAVAQAEQAAADMEWGPEIRRFRLAALAVALYIDGDKLGGDAIVDAYDRMDPNSVAFVDACVKEVWSGSKPTKAEKNGEGADAEVPDGTAVSASCEGTD